MTQLPQPPVPQEADLTDFRFMPLEVARLRRSRAWLICKRRPELAFYMINLWTASWHERPAGSLEDDDDVLADAAMCSPEKWPEVRDDVLRGWFKASDGRLYHEVVAEKVLDSWHGKAVARWKKECDRIRKENHQRKEKGLDALELPPKHERISASLPLESSSVSSETSGVPSERDSVPSDGEGNPSENALKGEGRDRDRDRKIDSSEAKASGAEAPGGDPASKLFSAGVDWLQSVTKKSNGQCRSLLGRWRKYLSDAELLELLARARAEGIQAPEAWFGAIIRERRKNPREGDPPPRSAAEVIAAREHDPRWAGVQ